MAVVLLKDGARTTDKSPMRRLRSVSLGAVLGAVTLLAALSAPAHAAWLPAAPIDAGAGAGPVVSAALAVAPDGRAIAAWVQRVDATPGSQARIWASAFSGGAWGAPTPLDVGTGDVSAPAAAIGGANGVVTFLQSDGTHRALWAARVVGGTIQATERIDAGTLASENVGGATVAVDDGGAITAVFSQYQAGRFRVLAARAVGGAWSAPALVDTGAGSGNAEGAPQVATRTGAALAVWAQGTGTRARIYGARFDGSAWQAAAALDAGAGLGPGDSPQAGTDRCRRRRGRLAPARGRRQRALPRLRRAPGSGGLERADPAGHARRRRARRRCNAGAGGRRGQRLGRHRVVAGSRRRTEAHLRRAAGRRPVGARRRRSTPPPASATPSRRPSPCARPATASAPGTATTSRTAATRSTRRASAAAPGRRRS